MKWQDSEAAKCRWSEFAEELFHDWNILWDGSTADYQGSGTFVAANVEGKCAYVNWSYGSCSGCDGWEGEPEDKIRDEFRTSCVEYFETFDNLFDWAKNCGQDEVLKGLAENKEAFDMRFIEDFEKGYNTH